MGHFFQLCCAAFEKVDGARKIAETWLSPLSDQAYQSVRPFLPLQYKHMGWALHVQPRAMVIPTSVHIRMIQGIINHRRLGKVSADYGWCLWFSMTESSCLEAHSALGGEVNLAD